MHQLLERLIVPAFRNRHLDSRHDSAVLEVGGTRIAFTTDSYVVRPVFFPCLHFDTGVLFVAIAKKESRLFPKGEAGGIEPTPHKRWQQ